ncbi:MAG: hypothetical protein V7661_00060 [Sulfitobacter sp.]
MPEQPIRNKPVPPQEAPKPAPKPAHPPGPAGGAKPAAVAPKPAQQQPAAAQPKVRAPAPSARAQLRHWLTLLSFLLFVGVPSIGTGLYLMAVAVDQYASKVGFSVRREDTSSALEVLGGLSSLSGSSSSDTDILYEFIQSQKLVSDINEELDLKRIWSGPSHDVVFALKEDASIEELVAYWNRMVRVSYGSGSGLIEVEVLAFSAEDATSISQTLLDRSSRMINELSDIARQDAIRYAGEELDEALERLKDARAVVTLFRNKNQIVNPEVDIQMQAGLLGNLQSQQAQSLIELDLLKGTVGETDPRLTQLTRRIAVIENRISEERKKLGVGGAGEDGTAFADLLGDYERLVVDREFAENSYVSALANYDAALAEARRKSRYLAAYMQPTEAETPEYPKRLTLFALVSLFLFLIWSVMILVVYSVRDRR